MLLTKIGHSQQCCSLTDSKRHASKIVCLLRSCRPADSTYLWGNSRQSVSGRSNSIIRTVHWPRTRFYNRTLHKLNIETNRKDVTLLFFMYKIQKVQKLYSYLVKITSSMRKVLIVSKAQPEKQKNIYYITCRWTHHLFDIMYQLFLVYLSEYYCN